MRRFDLIGVILALSAVLSSCFGGNPTSTSLSPFQPDSGDGYKKVSNFSFTQRDVLKTTETISLNSIGEQKILVVPVQIGNAKEWTSEMIDNTNKAFFGKAEETGWESVSSFYEASSYGKLHISGEVAPVFKVPSVGLGEPDQIVVTQFENSTSYDTYRKSYDKDNDGYIDSVVFMYSSPINDSRGYWAWVYWGESDPSLTLPTVNTYMWCGYQFICDKDSKQSRYAAYGEKVDAHTVIHETGHMLGLDDYYCYDDRGWDPSGAIEMHSNNIGDENIFSKTLLGWTEPYYVKTDSSVSLTLRSSALYGDAIIINDSWNNSACDEYLIIEYYSPHGMNAKDAASRYPCNNLQMYSKSGFRIYHIDARIVELNARGGMVDYADKIEDGKWYAVGASNSESYSYLNTHKNDYKLCHLLEAGGVNTFKKNKIATNATLFRKGNTFVANSEFFYNKDSFNNGNKVGYKISINECADFSGSITITKI